MSVLENACDKMTNLISRRSAWFPQKYKSTYNFRRPYRLDGDQAQTSRPVVMFGDNSNAHMKRGRFIRNVGDTNPEIFFGNFNYNLRPIEVIEKVRLFNTLATGCPFPRDADKPWDHSTMQHLMDRRNQI